MSQGYKKIINISLFFYLILSIFLLIFKSTKLNDFSISEMLINYNGGLIARGFLGHLIFNIHEFLNINLIKLVLSVQIFFSVLYTFLLYKIFNKKNLLLTKLDVLILLLPTLLFFPIYEIEGLGRKEILIFITYCYLILRNKVPSKKITLIYSLAILPMLVLSWELTILYFPFYFIVFWTQYRVMSLIDSFKIFAIFLPGLLAFLILWFNPPDQNTLDVMCKTINCLGRALELENFNIHFAHFDYVHNKASFVNYFRFLIFFLLSYLPIYFYLKKIINTKINLFLVSKFSNLNYLFLLMIIPQLIIFIFALDWGRYLNILITMTYLLLIFFRTSNIIPNIREFKIFNLNEKYINFLIIIYCFSWYPKLLLWYDTGSFPILRLINRIKDISYNLII
ncbi:hypothetical protein IDH27_02385 [Pelagibacterales bacterium SAG-MED46]|nr:hypothetical protein [Pelagibacterales bacterium SAG-MED46]